MDRLDFLITYTIMVALFIGLSWLVCTTLDYIENKLKQRPLQTITVKQNKHQRAA